MKDYREMATESLQRHIPGETGSISQPLRVIHVIPHLGGGGTERVVWTLLPLLDPTICEPSLCVLGSENAFPDRTARIQVDGFLGYEGSLRNIRGGIRCVRALRRLIESSGADIVHSHLWPAARITSLALRGLKARHVVHMHDALPWIEGRSLRSWAIRALTNRTMPGSRPTYIAVSESVKRYSCDNLRINPRDVRVIHNGVNLDRFMPRNVERQVDTGKGIVIGMLSLFTPQKGHEYLLKAAAQLASEGIEFTIRLAGSGSLRPKLEAIISELQLLDRVELPGLIDDVESFLHNTQIFVLPSTHREGMPMTLLEAMACGVPSIASDIPGPREVIDNGLNGLLVPPKDSAALADAIRQLAVDPGKRQQIGTRGLETVRTRFSFHRVARDIEKLYRTL